MAIQLVITSTSKGYGRNSKWSTFDRRVSPLFATKKEAMEWVREKYGKSKRAAMYVDLKDGSTIKCGYVIGFRAGDRYEGRYIQQDWVEFREIKTIKV